ncbi:MAG: hypothetical protein PWP15_998 [Methanothermococcus sp.]|jgi:hypothetical protein|nr:hypothetical protein [Methanothermococcus sp.]MDK2987632.1 hypothetical protein [Methanothermococcus sp.]
MDVTVYIKFSENMDNMTNKKLKKLAELILLKDSQYIENSKLKECLKKYIGIYNEICILEATLKDLDKDSVNVKEIQFLSREIQAYMDKVNEVEQHLNNLNKYKKISNYNDLKRCIKKMKNLNISIDDSLKWDIYNRIITLEKEIRCIERELELIILNYALSNTDFDKKINNCNNDDMFDILYDEVISYLEKDDQ